MRSGTWMLASVVLLAACKESLTVPGEQKYAIVEMDGTAGAAAGTYTLNTNATVFAATSAVPLPSGGSGNDQCSLQDYTAPVGGSGLSYLNPGSPFTITVSDTSDTLSPSLTSKGGTVWLAGPLNYLPADSATVVVPGFAGDTGIDPLTIKTRTAEVFDFSGVVIPSSPNNSMTISWTNPPADQATTMIVSLRYSSSAGGDIDKQVICAFQDDGSGTIFALQLQGWRTSTQHQAVFTRLRTDARRTGNSLLYTISTFAVTKPIS